MMRRLLLTASVLCLTGCAVGPDYTAPSQKFLDTWFSSDAKATSPEPISTAWWTIFEDPLLEQYVAAAAENNKDLKIALANIRSARAARREDGGAFLPQIGGNADADRSKSSGSVSSFNSGEIRNTYDAGFDASWELDIFGGNRRTYEASEARIGASVASFQDVMLSTLSDVARTYYEARGLQKRIAITEKNTQLLKETFDVIQDRMEIGETSNFDLSRAQGEYELTRARIPNLKAELRASIYSLSVLLGQPPEALLAEMEVIKPLPTPPDIVPVGLRSEILRRRPDIRIAERQLAASVADIGAETAELFPKFFLTGDISSSARTFGDVFSGGTGLWSLASMIQWSVFEGGAIRARIDAEEAESEVALAQYEKSVLEALRDAETTLTRYGEELETRKRLAQGVQSRRKSLSLAKQLFNAGEQDYLAVVDTERQLIDSEDDLIISETNSITKLIALYTALGGGWEHFE
jgi:multidrug efflux system outer membrane protein